MLYWTWTADMPWYRMFFSIAILAQRSTIMPIALLGQRSTIISKCTWYKHLYFMQIIEEERDWNFMWSFRYSYCCVPANEAPIESWYAVPRTSYPWRVAWLLRRYIRGYMAFIIYGVKTYIISRLPPAPPYPHLSNSSDRVGLIWAWNAGYSFVWAGRLQTVGKGVGCTKILCVWWGKRGALGRSDNIIRLNQMWIVEHCPVHRTEGLLILAMVYHTHDMLLHYQQHTLVGCRIRITRSSCVSDTYE